MGTPAKLAVHGPGANTHAHAENASLRDIPQTPYPLLRPLTCGQAKAARDRRLRVQLAAGRRHISLDDLAALFQLHAHAPAGQQRAAL